MITLGIFEMLLSVFEYLIGYMPVIRSLPDWFTPFMSLVRLGLYFFPADVFLVIIGNVLACNLGLIAWSVVEWCYKKIPGVS